ncbi:hypothetical protein E4U19_006978 [Claviceps sp. Clav32 group G5]|nr:hypothetical protein E4U19_006978 [Claviceps sp. Clav32 group G5]
MTIIESHTIHKGPTASHRDFTGFVDHLRDVLLNLPDQNQWIAINSRVEATERDAISSINDTLTAINNQLQQMRQDLQISTTGSQQWTCASTLDSMIWNLGSQQWPQTTTVNTRFTHTDSQLVGLRTLMEFQFQGVDRHFVDQNIRMDALHKNAMSRLDNRLPGASNDDLEPLFNLDTGQKIQDKPTRSGLDRMSYSDSCGDENLFARAGNYSRRVRGRETGSAETGIRYEDTRLSWVGLITIDNASA